MLVLLDMSAAFDTLDHTLLLACMKRTGVIDVAHQWFESYLSSRTQTVCLGCLGQTKSDPLELLQGVPQGSVLGQTKSDPWELLQGVPQGSVLGQTKSDPLELLQGVPQGSVLRPVLFTLYTEPIGQIIRQHRLDFHLFADDSQLYVSFKIKDTNDETIALARIQACIDELKAWMIHHRLQLNDSKTEIPHQVRLASTTCLMLSSVTASSNQLPSLATWKLCLTVRSI